MGQKVLVVEDNKAWEAILVVLMRHLGYQTSCASSAQDGLAKACAEAPDLILMDLFMPRVADGIEVTRLLKSNLATKDIPILVCTGSSDEGDKLNALQAGAAEVLHKPVSLRELGGAIRRQLKDSFAPKVSIAYG
jgi:twitching motility two-component system response regulator PilH